MSKQVKILIIVVLLLSLILLRSFYRAYLYDPFISYFHQDYLHTGFPTINSLNYTLTICIRFLINTVVSLLIIFLGFNQKQFVLLSIKIYVVFFVILLALFFIELNFNLSNSYMVLFYVRRFLIHPLLLLVLLPAFYYQKLINKKV